jgi:hypothetical protein
MFCNITTNKNGKIVVKADNGRPSLLYKHLRATIKNDKEALEKWAITKTPEFNALYSDNVYRDENSEVSMMYVLPQSEYLHYGKKDQQASAKAKDRINTEEDLQKAKDNIAEQSEIIRATILKQIGQFRVAESAGSRTNRYIDIANTMASYLNENKNAVDAITNFASYGSYYLKLAKDRIKTLKTQQDTNAHLETLNELGQLLIIFGNLQQFSNLTGQYEKSLFNVQMDGFFEEYGITVEPKMATFIRYSKGTRGDVFKIRNYLAKQVKLLKGINEEDKGLILKNYDKLVENSENLTSVLDDILRERSTLERQVRNDYYATLTDWLWPYVEENQTRVSKDLQITKEDFTNQLKKAKQDAGFGEYGLASLSTINDPIAQTIRLAAEQARQDAHRATIDDMSGLHKAKLAQFGDTPLDEVDFNKYLKDVQRTIKTIDEDGNEVYSTLTTKAIILPSRTEDLERDRNVEFDRQTLYFNDIEDAKIAKLDELVRKEGLNDKQIESALRRLAQAKEDKDFNIRRARNKAMNAWYETKYDIVKYKTDLINQKKLQLGKEEFKIWYSNNVYQRTIAADELDYHKKNRGKFRMIHPEKLDEEITDASYYRPGRSQNGKVLEYTVYEIFYGGEFTTPKDEYNDSNYAAIKDDKFYQELVKVYSRANNVLSNKHKLKHGIIPQIEKGGSFWKSNRSVKENVSELWKNLTPDVYDNAQDYEVEVDGIMMKVSRAVQNVDGTIVKTIPVKFVSLLDNVEDLDTNLIETFSKFAAVAHRHREMSKTDASARAMKNIITGNPELGIRVREAVLTDSEGVPAVTSLKNATTGALETAVKEKNKRLNALIIDFIDDVWYGDIEEKEPLTILGKKVSLNKISNFTSKWVSIQRLAGNLDSAISNLIIGRLSIFNESLAGRFYTLSEYYEASKIINRELYDGTVIKDYMQPDINLKSLYAQMMIRHDAIQGEFSNEYGIKVGKKTALEMSKDFLFFSQNGMEYTIQKRSMLCVSKGYKIALPDNLIYDRTANDGNGEIRNATSEEQLASEQARAAINTKYEALIQQQEAAIQAEAEKKPTTKEESKEVGKRLSKMRRDLENISERKEDELAKTATNYFTALDAYTQDADGAIQVKDSLKQWFTPKEENKLRRRIQELNKRQQGIYAAFDKSQMQRHWLGRLALMFRKYLYSAYEHRFGDRKANLALGEETYGYQRQFMNKFLADFKAYGSWAFTKMFDGSASPAEQYAINKTLIEYAIWASFMVLFALMKVIGDDDDEESWAFSKTAYIVKRTEDSLSEFALPFGIGTMVRTFKNPISSITLVEQIYEVFAVIFDDPLNLGGVYERDSGINEKGDSKFVGKLLKVAPVLRQYGKFVTPEEQLKYYTQRKTNI